MSIENLVNNLKDGNNVEAEKSFKTIMASKLNDALDAKKVELAGSMAKQKTEEE